MTSIRYIRYDYLIHDDRNKNAPINPKAKAFGTKVQELKCVIQRKMEKDNSSFIIFNYIKVINVCIRVTRSFRSLPFSIGFLEGSSIRVGCSVLLTSLIESIIFDAK